MTFANDLLIKRLVRHHSDMVRVGITLKFLAFWVLVLSLAGCATKYEPRVPGLFAGYQEEQLGERTYQIRAGIGWTSDRPNLARFALYRAAELTIEKGFQYFSILKSTAVTTYHSAGLFGFIEGQWSYLHIRLLEPSEISTNVNVVEAKRVMDDLKPFIEEMGRETGSTASRHLRGTAPGLYVRGK